MIQVVLTVESGNRHMSCLFQEHMAPQGLSTMSDGMLGVY